MTTHRTSAAPHAPTRTALQSPIQAINAVWRFSRPPWFKGSAVSTPGHLLHFMERGSYLLGKNDGEFPVVADDVVYYHESEEVSWTGNASRVDFISVSFLADSLSPIPPGQRVMHQMSALRLEFVELYDAFSGGENSFLREVRCHAALCRIVGALFAKHQEPATVHLPGEKWWMAEAAVRRNRQYRPALDELAAWAGCSRIALLRSCRRATGDTPVARIRRLRLNEAQGLLRFSELNVSQIAGYLGYPRIHEFSRDFAAAFSTSPRAFRNAPPQLE